MKSLLIATSLLASLTSLNLAQAKVQGGGQLTITAQTAQTAQTTSVAPAENITKQLTSSSGQATQEGRVVVMAIKGQISKKVLESIRNSIGNVNGDPIPAGLIVLLDSPGGDGIAAMKIGEILRTNKAHVFVTGQCASACIFVLASGVVRGAPAYTVGIHRGRITKSDENAKILEEIDVKSNPQARELLERFEKAVPVYFAKMGMPPELFQAMQSHQYKGVYRLSNEEIVFYGLSGFEPKYLDVRAELYEKMQGPYHMDKDELHRRTLKVASRCAEFDQKHTAFINCYKQVLKDPFLN
ncbi:ATP-dependent Clp protease proteolytic subunit [Polynucleobacter sp. MWH-Svant-W18]|uniref:ATP-dependent Clp protease proteolytic subunit n=1 Tax=Polynucleobacter sp. MWH-Svant-W18 TaxID=1855909 RepID=UPI001BFDA8E5|nr:ATP-dependent Clp protease proteolytic subunit [Polynucleobacter sp. MWH-Svant-W18]QWD77378.1 ATP-dependent Clp protease proteolytic subunit [Polynucleobacter sp. MWH-Svant-W18]